MAVTTLCCPACQATLRSANEIPTGKRVKCPKCSKVFTSGGEEAAPMMAAIVEDEEEASGLYEFTDKKEPEEDTKKKKKKRELSQEDDDEDDDLKERLRNKKKGRRTRSSSGSSSDFPIGLVVVCALLLILFGGGGMGAYYYFVKLNRNKSTGQEELTAFLPDDAASMFGLNVAELSKLPDLAAEIPQVNTFLQRGLGMSFVSQVAQSVGMQTNTFVDRIVAANSGAGSRVLIVKSRVPFDPNKVRSLAKEASRERHNGKTYWSTKEPEFPWLYMPSDTILVLANFAEEKWHKVLDQDPTKSAVTGTLAPLVKKSEASHGWLISNPEADVSFIAPDIVVPRAGIAGRSKEVKGLGLRVNLSGGQLRFQMTLLCADEATAVKAGKEFKTFLSTLQASSTFFPKALPATRELVAGAQYSNSGSTAEVSTQVSLKNLGEAIRALEAGPGNMGPGRRIGGGGR